MTFCTCTNIPNNEIQFFGNIRDVFKAVQLEYRWYHPTDGEVNVRSSGIRSQDDHGRIVLEGYHRLLAGMEKA